CNSRLDTIQASILNIKLKYLDAYSQARNEMAARYDSFFQNVDGLQIPTRQPNSTHVFHQYTLKIKNGRRDDLQNYLAGLGIPSMIYYPLPLYKQDAFRQFSPNYFRLEFTEELCDEVLSLPIHTEMNTSHMDYMCNNVINFFKKA
ncbi:MAG: transcriptional regulator, partial [Chitinophagia bacterium]|nr:transcriptional regulator [Chitinophagia bacterium]